MEFELVFLITAAFFLFFDLYQLTRAKNKRKLKQGTYGAAIGFVLVLVAYALLLQAFLTDNFSFSEVYTYSSSSLSLISKISASWASGGGSLLLLLLFISAFYFAYRLSIGGNATPSCINSSRVLNILAIFFVIMNIGKNPFARLASTPPDGTGLVPALQSPWMMVHPPIVFLGYALVLLAFALILGAMKNGEISENRLLRVSAGAAWLLMTIGIALGGIWAYEELGWGGYWSWDPVETGSLLVWIALTGYFFVGPLARSGKSLVREFTMFAAFVSLILLSALTRGGLLTSVHAYALSPAGPILIGLAVAFGMYFLYIQRKLRKPVFSLDVDWKSMRSVSIALGFVGLAALFLGSFLGIVVPIIRQFFTTGSATPSSLFYNSWSFPFAVLILMAMVGYALRDKLNFKTFGGLGVSCLAAGLILVFLGLPTSDFLANLGLPFLVMALVCVSYDLAKTAIKSNRTLKSFGRKILFLGMIIGLFGILFSASMKQTTTLSNIQFNSEGVATAQALGMSFTLSNCTVSNGEGRVYSPNTNSTVAEHSTFRVSVEINQGDTVYRNYVYAELYTNHGPLLNPLVLQSAQGDIILHFAITDELVATLSQGLQSLNVSTPQTVTLVVSVVPMVYLLWIGIILMSVGISINIIGDSRKPKKQVQEEFL